MSGSGAGGALSNEAGATASSAGIAGAAAGSGGDDGNGAGGDGGAAGVNGGAAGGDGGAAGSGVEACQQGKVSCIEGATCVAGVCVAAACHGTLELSGLPVPAVEGSPYFVSLTDLNRDGIEDIALSELGVSQVSVLLGKGYGTFEPVVDYRLDDSLGTKPAFGDFDGDGDIDLAVGTLSGVRLLTNQGNGAFEVAAKHESETYATSVDVGDFDGDGRPDLVVATSWEGAFRVLHNAGQGTFQAGPAISTGQQGFWLTAQDLNGDGKPDLLFSDYYQPSELRDGVGVLLNNGNGTWAAAAVYDTPNGATYRSITVADLDHDGAPDLISAGWANNLVSVRLGNGDGSFGSAKTYAGGLHPSVVGAGDVNGDGQLDVILQSVSEQSNGGGIVRVLLGNGDGSLAAPVSHAITATNFALRDMNADGRTDLVGPHSQSNDVAIILGQSDGTFLVPRSLPVGDSPAAQAWADFDLDGRPDLAVTNGKSNDLSVLLASGGGGFAPLGSYPLSDTPGAVVTADLNGDAWPDIAVQIGVAPNTASRIGVLLNRHDGTFDPPVSYPAAAYATGLAVADLNGDSAIDVAVTDYLTGTLDVLLNDGHGKLAAPVAHDAGGAGISGLVAVDLNGDQRADLASFTPGEVRVLLAEGQGSFAAPAHYSVGQFNQGIAAVDLNRDGHLDLVISDTPVGVVRVLRNDGAGGFALAASYPADPDPNSVASSDLNADAWPDLVIGHRDYLHDYVTVLLNAGDGSLTPPIRYRAGGTDNAPVVSADLDANGRLDLVIANGNRDQVTVLLNFCRP